MKYKMLIGALSGAAVGLAGSLLLAPNSGNHTRGSIRGGLRDLGSSVRKLFVDEEEVEEQPAKARGKMPIPGEVEHPNPKVINPTHAATNDHKVSHMTHKNKNNLSGRH